MCKLQSRCQSELWATMHMEEHRIQKHFQTDLQCRHGFLFIFEPSSSDCWRTIANKLFFPKFSWNGNLTEHLRHEIVRQQYKCLHPVRFVSEPRSCSGCATVRFLSLSGGAQSANSTSLKQARRLAKASWFTLHARRVSPSGSSRSSKSYHEDLLFGHGGSLTLSHPSFLHSSPFPDFWVLFFSPVVLSQSLEQSPEWFSIFTEWYALIGVNSESQCFAQLHGDTEWLHTWAAVNVIATAWRFLRCNSRFKFQQWQSSLWQWPSSLMKLYFNRDWIWLEIYVVHFNLQPNQVSNLSQMTN